MHFSRSLKMIIVRCP